MNYFKFQNIQAANEFAKSEGSNAVCFGHAVRCELPPKNKPTKLATSPISAEVRQRLDDMVKAYPVQSPPDAMERLTVDIDEDDHEAVETPAPKRRPAVNRKVVDERS